MYFALERVLFFNLDASNKRGFSLIVFYFKSGVELPINFVKWTSGMIEPILFISKLYSASEKYYKSTKLEVAYLV